MGTEIDGGPSMDGPGIGNPDEVDALLEKIMDASEAGEAAKPKVEDEPESPSAASEDEGESEGSDPEPEEESGSEEGTRESWDLRTDDEALDAWNTLRRDHFPSEVLTGLTREQLLEMGAKRRTIQETNDSAFAELRALKAGGGSNPTLAGDENGGGANLPVGQVAPAVASLAEELGIESADLVAAMSAAIEAQVAPLREQLKGRDVEVAHANAELARRSVGERFPSLIESDETFGKVLEHAARLGAAGEHSGLSGAARDRALIETAARLDGIEEADSSQARTNRRKASQPTKPTRKPPKKPMSTGELVTAKANYIIDHPGVSAEEVISHFGG